MRREKKYYAGEYFESHKEKILARKKDWLERNNEKMKAYWKAYNEAHREEIRVKKHVYYLKRKAMKEALNANS